MFRISYNLALPSEFQLMLDIGVYRKISKKRAKKLHKRGESIVFDGSTNNYYWEPYWHAPNPFTANGLPWLTAREAFDLAKRKAKETYFRNFQDKINTVLITGK
ncbi:hypothetical protein [Sessilibacter corallicola]|uniref:hypothetical protein n=1 Tax=Sessilibacter corallicola TaxID=2904075 RepID=UPI001E57D7D9|nr:hypothetical protein [Sessilibacter corallicola]MCE2029264.1 hypothetical protein [Sessilibacter corallicola]